MTTQSDVLEHIIETSTTIRDHWVETHGLIIEPDGTVCATEQSSPTKRQVARRLRECGLFNKYYLRDHHIGMYFTLGQEIEEHQAATRIHLSRSRVQSLRADFRDFIPSSWTEGMVRIMKSSTPSGFVTFAKPVTMYGIGGVDAIGWTTRDKSFFDSDTDGLAITAYVDEPFIVDSGVGEIVVPARQISGFVLNIAFPDTSVTRLTLASPDAVSESDQQSVEASILEQLGLILSSIAFAE